LPKSNSNNSLVMLKHIEEKTAFTDLFRGDEIQAKIVALRVRE